MRPIKKLVTRAAAGTTTLGLAVAGISLVGNPAAHAKLTETEYGLQATAYGTRVVSEMLGASSDRTAWSWISCTTLAGIKKSEKIAKVQLPADDPSTEVNESMIRVGAAVSNTRTFKNLKKGIVAGSEGTNSVASVSFGSLGGDTPLLTIKGLESTSRAWADKKGKLHAENDVSAAKVSLINLPPEVPAELRELADLINSGVNDVIGQVIDMLQADENNAIVIPGLGEIGVTYDRVNTRNKFQATAEGAALKIRLYGPNTVKGGGDDTVVNVGHSWARISRDLPIGIFQGSAHGASVELFDGIVGVGRLGLVPMPCRGTDGDIRTNNVVGLDLGNAGMLGLSTVKGKAMGKPKKNGAAVAWTEGSIADINLGGDSGLQLKGIVGKAKVKMNKFGKITTRNIKGSSIGELIVGGESMGSIGPGETAQVPADQLPEGVLGIKFFDEKPLGKRGIQVSAVVIKLAEGSPLGSEIRLGNAQVRIQRY